jgi:hypothetical protein
VWHLGRARCQDAGAPRGRKRPPGLPNCQVRWPATSARHFHQYLAPPAPLARTILARKSVIMGLGIGSSGVTDSTRDTKKCPGGPRHPLGHGGRIPILAVDALQLVQAALSAVPLHGFALRSLAVGHIVNSVLHIVKSALGSVANAVLLVFDGPRHAYKRVATHRYGQDGSTHERNARAALDHAKKGDITPQQAAALKKKARAEFGAQARALHGLPCVEAIMQALARNANLRTKVRCVIALDESDMFLAHLAERFPDDVWIVTSDLDMVVRGVPSFITKLKASGKVSCIHVDTLFDPNFVTNDLKSITGPYARFGLWDRLGFTALAVLTGCDYFSFKKAGMGLKGVGIVRAQQLVAIALAAPKGRADWTAREAYARVLEAVRPIVSTLAKDDTEAAFAMIEFEQAMVMFHSPPEYHLRDGETLTGIMEGSSHLIVSRRTPTWISAQYAAELVPNPADASDATVQASFYGTARVQTPAWALATRCTESPGYDWKEQFPVFLELADDSELLGFASLCAGIVLQGESDRSSVLAKLLAWSASPHPTFKATGRDARPFEFPATRVEGGACVIDALRPPVRRDVVWFDFTGASSGGVATTLIRAGFEDTQKATLIERTISLALRGHIRLADLVLVRASSRSGSPVPDLMIVRTAKMAPSMKTAEMCRHCLPRNSTRSNATASHGNSVPWLTRSLSSERSSRNARGR